GFATFTSSHTFTGQTAGSHTVTLRDANLCTSSQSITVGAPAAPSLSLTATDATCAGVSNGSVTATFSGGVGTISTIFSQDFLASSTLSSYIATPAASIPGQWNAIRTTGTGGSVSIVGGALQIVHGSIDSWSRTTDLSPAPTAMIYKFDMMVTGVSAAA